ncbi:hypothetical protein [Endozoicomonas lisbonensis]|uniref:Uncharacterized protein n=1 Tax=Endozoicomonas lisbonensis TaxID=3120522 RepID=A0ABV2SL79_9GAMM
MNQIRMSAGLKQAVTDELLKDVTQFDRIRKQYSLKTGVLERFLGEHLHARLLINPQLNIKEFLDGQLPVMSKERSENLADIKAELRAYRQIVDQLLQKLQEKTQ